jgi:hypothetical protein
MEIHKQAGPSQRWTITAEFSEDFRAIIDQCTGQPSTYAGGLWKMTVANPETMVPDVMTRLCAAGCRIQQVGPEGRDLKGKIKTHYENH